MTRTPAWGERMPGVGVAALAAVVAWLVHLAVPAVPLLTVAVAAGIVAGQVPRVRPHLDGALRPGLAFSGRTLLRAGIVLLGLQLGLGEIVGLGWVTVLTTIGVVVLTFAGTWWLGRAVGLPGHEPLLVASGFAICGASAIGAMGGAVRARQEEQAVPVALVTLCGTLAIAVLPALWHPLGLTAAEFGHWVGAGVHDVGQVVATAQVAGASALAVAVVVKLTRVLLLAPMVAIAASVERRRVTDAAGPRPAIVHLFIVGFLAAVLLRTFVPLPEALLGAAEVVQTTLLAMALFALGSSIRVGALLHTGWRALVVGLSSWALVAALAYGAVLLG
ncbi:YeiH family protein [Agromyces indicus]|uniref:Sulfate exporter family transporter n=1 Tax=Agromyces indicus TaxID=758919 RepID=A0ABU1FIU6_9MICO|nr:putative sulfate exporter family transporter [Agromyces indicus]MDR5691677.1 putative sulfate exporter family transporter [Agromyces indicus]